MEYLHIYDFIGDTKGGIFHPTKLIHSNGRIVKKKRNSILLHNRL
jgi:hypothetical protein